MEVDDEAGKGKEKEKGEEDEEGEVPSWLPPLPHPRTYKRERGEGEGEREGGQKKSGRAKKKRKISGSTKERKDNYNVIRARGTFLPSSEIMSSSSSSSFPLSNPYLQPTKTHSEFFRRENGGVVGEL
eukprot:CAMPEP_0201543164 /NCGR_PEP_ID=MMETSP0161_2-20130828/72441_1 /ASSEMBLY_ACC=CAM_ASM_000251 /TAXON_ID=180227 /ORGANISM="Neoparamoeba aestuarina, Strain SoJaBio B1-5/56/2" /LENGTH=127 /DNA_ID=CAMNT_0047950901 /DNA_START=623 /DNA_END=1003 /DNA_ORIENTATION=+